MPVINCQHLEKTFGPKTILSDVTLTIRSGERVGLVGNNGSGKSTLGRILAGEVETESGEISKKRGARVAYLSQEPRFPEGATPRDVILGALEDWGAAKRAYDEATAALESGEDDADLWIHRQSDAAVEIERLGGWERMHEAESIMGHLGIHEADAPLERMSGGERRRVALAVLLTTQPDLAILDEPTNHLDVLTIEWLETFLLERYRGALLLITHDRYVLNRVVQRTLELERGQVFSYDGGYEAFLVAKAERNALAERVESNRQNFLRRELEWLRRQPKARTTKSKARVDRAEAQLAKSGPEQDREATLRVEGVRSGKTILEVKKACFEIGGKKLFRDLDLSLVKGERIGVVGPNGTGKTSLLNCVLEKQSLTSGELVLGKNTQIGYLDQLRSGLHDDETVLENVAGENTYLKIDGNPLRAGSYLEKFLFDGGAQRQKVGVLSGGERARVCLAKLLCRPSNLLVLDEPTNDLDVATLGALEEMLLEYEGCALIVSHDRWFLDRVATSILAFEGDEKVDLHRGGYTAYKEKVEIEQARESRRKAASSKAQKNQDSGGGRALKKAASRKLSFKERRELEGLLDKIEALEFHAVEIEGKISDPAVYSQAREAMASLASELEETRQQIEALSLRWEELESLREN